MEDKFIVSENAWRLSEAGYSSMFIMVGDEISVENLLRGIIVASGNDACIALAEGIAGTEEEFAIMMTAKAKELGMEYMQVPVDFSNPLPDEFYAFADSMERNRDKKTLLHCQVNARATAFSFLYRVIYDDVSLEVAKADMNTVWQPNEVWRDFIFEVLSQNNIDPNCSSCDWTPPPSRGQ